MIIYVKACFLKQAVVDFTGGKTIKHCHFLQIPPQSKHGKHARYLEMLYEEENFIIGARKFDSNLLKYMRLITSRWNDCMAFRLTGITVKYWSYCK